MLVILGWSVLLVLLAAGTWLLMRHSRRFGIGAIVATGLGLRLAIATITHAISLLNGNGGFLYGDARGYLGHAETIAESWTSGSPEPLLNPVGILVHGGPLFYDLTATVFFLTDGHGAQVAMKLVNVLLASTMILSVWIVAEAVAGRRVAKLAAWMTAVMPTLVWWSTPMMKEPLAGALFMGVLAMATRLPRLWSLALTTLLMSALALSRITVALAAAAGLAAWLSLRVLREWQRGGRQLLPATVAAYAGLVLLMVLVVGGEEIVSDTVARGREEAKKPANGIRSGLEDDSFDSPIGSKLAEAPLTEAIASGTRFVISPRAWAFTTQRFDWYQPLYPMMWLWYVLFPAGLVGLWRLRRRPDVLLLLVPFLGLLALYAVTLSSGARQRSAAEPLVLIMIGAGIAAYGWRWTARAGALVLVVVAAAAALDLSQPLAAVPILAGAVAMWAVSGRLPNPSHRARTTEAVPAK